MLRGLVTRLWRHDRPALAVVACGSLVATVLWGGISRPMADTVGYRSGADILREGWPTILDRTPGYPLVLLLTGSSDRSTHLLFAVQLAMHVVSICLVIDLARAAGVGRNGRIALAVLLQAPAVMLRVLHEGTEATSALLLTVIAYLLLRPVEPSHGWRRALALGTCCGMAGLVRPTFALVWVPVAAIAAIRWRALLAPLWSTAAVAGPALLLVGGLVGVNAARFDRPTLTPLAAYHLSSKTSPYVEELPTSYEPARSVLIRERDRALLRGESSAPANFIWRARPALEDATGLRGQALDDLVMEMDIWLIVHNPFAYLDTVKTASVNYTSFDSQPAILGLGRPAAWLQQALHQILLLVFAGLMALVPGLALAGRVRRRQLWTMGVGLTLALYTALVSVASETGTARLRSPAEPILAMVLVLAASIVHGALADRPWRKG